MSCIRVVRKVNSLQKNSGPPHDKMVCAVGMYQALLVFPECCMSFVAAY